MRRPHDRCETVCLSLSTNQQNTYGPGGRRRPAWWAEPADHIGHGVGLTGTISVSGVSGFCQGPTRSKSIKLSLKSVVSMLYRACRQVVINFIFSTVMCTSTYRFGGEVHIIYRMTGLVAREAHPVTMMRVSHQIVPPYKAVWPRKVNISLLCASVQAASHAITNMAR